MSSLIWRIIAEVEIIKNRAADTKAHFPRNLCQTASIFNLFYCCHLILSSMTKKQITNHPIFFLFSWAGFLYFQRVTLSLFAVTNAMDHVLLLSFLYLSSRIFLLNRRNLPIWEVGGSLFGGAWSSIVCGRSNNERCFPVV